MTGKIKVGDRVKTSTGWVGTVASVHYCGASGSTCSYISRVQILLDNGITVEVIPEMIKVLVQQ